jgi:decaprenyl-phosphate phosphoribosyltransferase
MKNLLVAAAPAAGGVLSHGDILAKTAVAFVSFCLAASGTYMLNDVADADADRVHPTKRNRPIASGQVPAMLAVVVGIVLLLAGIGVGVPLGGHFVEIVVIYVASTVLYSIWLKKVAVLDIALVASFYVLRALGGGVATGVRISPWFLVLVSALSLFVVAGKRHYDHVALDATGVEDEPTDRLYTLPFLRYIWMMASVLAISAYTLWAFETPHIHDGVAWSEVSIALFALGVLRYALLIERGEGGVPEEVLLKDRPIQAIGAIWLVVYGIGVYTH